jgi:AcrR family transcriptional regulator
MALPRQYRRTLTERASTAGDEARARILAIAFELMAEKGYRGTSIAQVAARAGISQSGLLHHFPSKQALLIAVIDYRQEVDSSTLEDADGNPLLGWAAFDALAELVRTNSRRPQVVRMFATLCAEALDADHPAHAWIQDHYIMCEQTLVTAIEAGIEAGTMHPDMPPATIAHLTVAIMDGLQLQWLAGEGMVDMAAEFEAYVDHLKLTWEIDAGEQPMRR